MCGRRIASVLEIEDVECVLHGFAGCPDRDILATVGVAAHINEWVFMNGEPLSDGKAARLVELNDCGGLSVSLLRVELFGS